MGEIMDATIGTILVVGFPVALIIVMMAFGKFSVKPEEDSLSEHKKPQRLLGFFIARDMPRLDQKAHIIKSHQYLCGVVNSKINRNGNRDQRNNHCPMQFVINVFFRHACWTFFFGLA